ncbi:MAG: hypothetical protein WBV73_12890 [Phormidium sp.]
MTNASDYLTHIKALIVLNPKVVNWTVVREEVQGDRGLLRYRLTLKDGSLLELFEFFAIASAEVQPKYLYPNIATQISLPKYRYPNISTQISQIVPFGVIAEKNFIS